MSRQRISLGITLLVVAIALVVPASAVAYKEDVHAALTQEAVYFYNQNFKGNPIKSGDIRNLMAGARAEDEAPRMLNHFYDPINKRGLVFGGKTWTASKEWVKSPDTQTAFLYNRLGRLANFFDSEAGRTTDYTWQRAIKDFVDGDRERAMRGLGHVVHLIQDATVPAHTRNDPHPPTDENDKEWGGPDPYEEWTAKFVPPDEAPRLEPERINTLSLLRASGKKPVQLPSLEKYFDEVATYTNTHFYSKDSVGFNYYALPGPRPTDRIVRNGFTFIGSSDQDGGYILAKEKKSDPIRFVKTSGDSFTKIELDDEAIHSDYWKRLSQKAVQYSAGVMNLFFQEVAKEQARRGVKAEASNFVGSVLSTVQEDSSPSAQSELDLELEKEEVVVAAVPVVDEAAELRALAEQLAVAQAAIDALERQLALRQIKGVTTDEPFLADEPKAKLNPSRGGGGGGGSAAANEDVDLGEDEEVVLDENVEDVEEDVPVAEAEAEAEATVLISEIYPDMVGADTGEFVELYNASDADVDISGWSLQYLAGSATSTEKITKKNFEPGAVVPAKGFYLIGLGGYVGSVAADMTWSQALNNDGATVFLVAHQNEIVTESDADIIDRVGYGSGDGLILAEDSAVAMPEEGSSVERRPAGCGSFDGDEEFSGNGCDMQDNSADLVVVSEPNPQNSQSFIEPRSAPSVPVLSVNYEAEAHSYARIDLSWSEATDFQGSTSSVVYVLFDEDGAELYRGSDLEYEHRIIEVNRDYDFTAQAFDAEGFGSDVGTASVNVPNYISSLNWTESADSTPENPIYILNIAWDVYPFVPVNIPFNGEVFDSYHTVVFQLNSDPFTETMGHSFETYGWSAGGAMPNPLWVKYPRCVGDVRKTSGIIFPDTEKQCNGLFGSPKFLALHKDYLADGGVEATIFNLSFGDGAPTAEDYIMISYYAYVSNLSTNQNSNMRFVAMDTQRYYFEVPVAPVEEEEEEEVVVEEENVEEEEAEEDPGDGEEEVEEEVSGPPPLF